MLSAFPVPEESGVEEYAGRTDLLGPAARSLKLRRESRKKSRKRRLSRQPPDGILFHDRRVCCRVSWLNYSAPYDFSTYRKNRQECMEEIKGAIDNWFAVADDSGMLKGFYEFSFHEEQGEKVMEIGLGMRPEETGKGMGLKFVNAGISYARSFYHYERGTVVMLAADFNRRAIKTYERAGFVRYGERRAVSYGSRLLLYDEAVR
ncbi:MAG: GNAT family N-acetyltransferase [Eisenbergiella sp.]